MPYQFTGFGRDSYSTSWPRLETDKTHTKTVRSQPGGKRMNPHLTPTTAEKYYLTSPVPADKMALVFFAQTGKANAMSEQITELTDTTFDQIVHNSDVPVLVDFWAPWCGPCKMMTPIIEEIASEYAGKARVCKLNTDESRDSALEFGITAIPTTILFKDGQVQKKWVGLTAKKQIAEAIEELIQDL